MNYVFWFSLVVLVYTYLGYPLYILLRAKMTKDRIRKDINYKPFVSVVFSAYNEEGFVEKKIRNLLESLYPHDRLEVLVGSDGSDDGTGKILSGISDGRVRPFIFQDRRGKVNVLNELVQKAKGEILVFCDTRQLFDKDSVGRLVANLSDKRVGCVSGELIFSDDLGRTGVSEGVGIYWEYEKFIRRCESKVYSMIGATGAIYAIRKELYSPPPKNTILDDVYIPLAISRCGYRCIVDKDAKAYDRPAFIPKEEYRRKVRTLAGNHQIFVMFKDLFIPSKSIVAMPLFSHKFLRAVAPFLIILVFLSNLFLTTSNLFYAHFLIGQILFYSLAALGAITYKDKNKKFFSKPASAIYMFCLMNFTALVGFYRFVFGKQGIAWEK